MGKSFPAQQLPILVKMNMQLQNLEEADRNYVCYKSSGAAKDDLDDVEVLKNQLKASAVLSDGNTAARVRNHVVQPTDVADKLLDSGIDSWTALGCGENDYQFNFEVSKKSEVSPDDTDATISVSSDNTIEPDGYDNHVRLHDGKVKEATLKDGRRGSYASLSKTCQSPEKESLPKFAEVMPQSKFTDDVSIDIGASGRFSKVLENISLPLLYIPNTKQLVKSDAGSSSPSGVLQEGPSYLASCDPQIVVHPDTPSQGVEARLSNNLTLDLSPNQLLSSSSSPLHKAHSVQEFEHLAKLADGDRLTLHSVDSCPGFHINTNAASQDQSNPYGLFADNSSLSSVSTGTDFSVSAVSVGEDYVVDRDATDEALFMDVNLNSRNSYDTSYCKSSSLDSGYGDKKPPDFNAAAKKKSFSGLKSLFTKRPKEDSPPGWKLFGRVPPKSTTCTRPANEISLDYQSRQARQEKLVEKPTFPAGKKQASEVMSTTALILENRPTNLPCKNPEEAEKHRQQYEEMVEAAKRKELKDLKLKKKQQQQQRKQEDQLMAAAKSWSNDILPNWDSMRTTKKVRDLWWMGLPPSVRGKVWQLAIGNDLNITNALYNICHERAEERIKFVQDDNGSSVASESSCDPEEIPNKESSVKAIKLDVSRTFPQLCIFQKGGPFYDLLHNLLGAYACYRPDVGYVQGMSFIAAILLLNMDVADAFVCFANLLNRPCQLAFFRMDENLMTAYYRTFEEFLKENLPKLHAHFINQSVTPNLYIMEWVFLLYSKSLPLDVACRVWDVYFRDGEEFLFRTAIAILKLYEPVLLSMDFIHAAQFLTKLPENISGDQLFRELDSVRMNIDKRGFQAVHAFFKDLHTSSS